ncbi:MAG: hypothetical protein DLM66_00090 [Candidatus Dormiibacter spiritus]|nr:MAG: hypothetical protein DLM66_00090 [Candidatus Dormibacteraeota bacterium]
MDSLAGQLLTTFLESADTIPDEVSPRRLDLVGYEEIREILAEMGKVNRDGEPLSYKRVTVITKGGTNPPFPKPHVVFNDGLRPRRAWRRADVIAWAPTWDQRPGNPGSSPQRRKRGG